MRVGVRIVALVLGYLAYAVVVPRLPHSVGARGADSEERTTSVASEELRRGRAVWRAGGCQSCHSIYGLGGHTGPDLTNIAGLMPGAYITHVVRAGLPGMPRFDFDAEKSAALVAYLAEIDGTGIYPPRELTAPVFGERR